MLVLHHILFLLKYLMQNTVAETMTNAFGYGLLSQVLYAITHQ